MQNHADIPYTYTYIGRTIYDSYILIWHIFIIHMHIDTCSKRWVFTPSCDSGFQPGLLLHCNLAVVFQTNCPCLHRLVAWGGQYHRISHPASHDATWQPTVGELALVRPQVLGTFLYKKNPLSSFIMFSVKHTCLWITGYLCYTSSSFQHLVERLIRQVWNHHTWDLEAAPFPASQCRTYWPVARRMSKQLGGHRKALGYSDLTVTS